MRRQMKKTILSLTLFKTRTLIFAAITDVKERKKRSSLSNTLCK